MARVRSRDTAPELIVRRFLHARGLRFRLHARDLPGKPDIIFSKRRIAIFVHGCFWHQHAGCKKAKAPKTRAEFWQAKLDANVERDASVQAALRQIGWKPTIIWECEIGPATLDALAREIRGDQGT